MVKCADPRKDAPMEQMDLFLSLAVTFDPDCDGPDSLAASLEEIIGIWSPLGASGYVRTFSISPSQVTIPPSRPTL